MAREHFTPNTAPLVRSAEQEVLHHPRQGNRTGLILDAEATGDLAGALEIQLDIGGHGAPPHYHTRSGELFYVITGKAEILYGEEVLTLSAGDTVLVPPRVVHAFDPAPGSEAHLFTVLTPATQRFNYFRLIDRISRGEAERAELLASQELYDNYFVTSAAWEGRRGITPDQP